MTGCKRVTTRQVNKMHHQQSANVGLHFNPKSSAIRTTTFAMFAMLTTFATFVMFATFAVVCSQDPGRSDCLWRSERRLSRALQTRWLSSEVLMG